MKRLVIGLVVAMALVCGAYTIIYLVRWEWNRALIAGLFFVAMEILLCLVVLMDRLDRVEIRLDGLQHAAPRSAEHIDARATTLDALRESRPEPRDHFAWIRDQHSSTNVFLPVLLGAGLAASALAWIVERLARLTVWPVREQHLSHQLVALAPPAGGLTGPALPATRPRRRRWSVPLAVLALVLVALGTAAVLDFVADRTQTRPDGAGFGRDTVIELELYGELAAVDPERTFAHLWSVCTGPDVFRLRVLPEPDVVPTADGTLRLVVDAYVGEHSMARLRGCLNDVTLSKVQARVVRAETVAAG